MNANQKPVKPGNPFRILKTTVVITLLGLFSAGAATAPYQLVFTNQPVATTIGAGLGKVAVQLADRRGVAVAQSGTAIKVTLNKNGGLTGTTNLTTDASGKVIFADLKLNLPGNSYALTATATGLRSAVSTAFNVGKGSVTITETSSSSNAVYGQNITFTATVKAVAPATNLPTGTVTFKDGSVTLGAVAINASGLATFSTNKISAVTTNHLITAIYSGDGSFTGNTASNLVQNVTKLSLTVSGILASNKTYDGSTNVALNFTNAKLVTVLAGDTVTLVTSSAKGSLADKKAGTGKSVSISGLTLGGTSAGNYSLVNPTATADIAARSLAITAKGVNKIYDGSTNATVTLTDNRLTGDIFTNSYTAAAFTNKNVGTAIPINVKGLTIGGTDAGNYALSNLIAFATANISTASVTVSNAIANNKVYDATATATLNFASAKLIKIFPGDDAVLNAAAAKGLFASKTVGTGKGVQISGLALTGTNAGNYLLLQPTAIASITPRPLAITAKSADKVYDGTTTATATLADNHLVGDSVSTSFTNAAFATKNAGSNIIVTVSGLAFSGIDATNYTLGNLTAQATNNITPATLNVLGVLANNKVYDRTTTATLTFSNATLATIIAGDVVTLNSASATGLFASKTIGPGKAVTISGLALAGKSAANYKLIQPAATADITARSLTITAKGVNKPYDGSTNATVTLTDNRVVGDMLTNSYAAASFITKNAKTNIVINVIGLAVTGTDATNYVLPATNITTTGNISSIVLTVAAANVTRPYATTNPILPAAYSGFVAGESILNSDVVGAPALTTTAKTNSPVGTYPISIAKGSLLSTNYSLKFTNGILTVIKANTAALLSTTLNPALTNQNVTFAAQIKPLAASVLPLTGTIQFKCNGTNKLGNAVALSGGLANLTVIAASLGKGSAVVTAEYSDPAGNFAPSTNSLTQSVVITLVPPPPSQISLAPSFVNGTITARLSGTAGQTYVIEASADLVHWLVLSTNIADSLGIVSLIDSNAVAFPSRFYRAYSP
jgi:hypothetical protein